MDESQTNNILQVSNEKNVHLTTLYSEDEVKEDDFSKWSITKLRVQTVFQLSFMGVYQSEKA
jgi:hypothetical protein